jgi:hypothetical protein
MRWNARGAAVGCQGLGELTAIIHSYPVVCNK